ncbi:M10 family metallopeptidase C-terminal domain-containing protein [Aquabacterium sp.]|uniref:M10 family metallopeptidase C-terminal domain-containing protein n=1 Tax=Aquabacterium sp. TaxID=1872578 RepID=UPI002C05D4F5|nr:M10 family metallopeptidase C-terminal domain-containing protein [Aquabacterium sp.]HSW04214.1 M10 family metallopeptidase C-terminal domain-containing protein [Aquabacterium sp.]
MAAPVFTLEQITQQLQRQWGGADEGTTRTWYDGTLDYAMPDAAPNNNRASEADGFIPMTATQKAFAREAFELWDDLIQTNLSETSSQDAQITLAYSSTTTDGGTYTTPFLTAQAPGSSTFDREIDHQRAWMSSNAIVWPELQDANMGYGERGMETYVHEIGHALGLSHPGSYNAGDGSSYENAEYSQDTLQWTIMSYWAAGADGTPVDRIVAGASDLKSDGINASTPLLHDIAAIQAKYGADVTTRTGDTVYGFNSNADRGAFNFNLNPNPVIAIWDAGGNDTLDCSGFSQDQRIDLNAGAFSDVGALTLNVAIAYNVDIENANGGTGNDALTGHDGDNILNGMGGNDRLIGAGGADLLYGADGDDTLEGGFGYIDSLYGGAGDDTYLVDDQDALVEAFDAGHDTVRSSVRWVLGDNLEVLILTGSASVNAFGNSLDNLLFGNDGNNYLQGAGGADTLAGGNGNDYYELGDLWLMDEQSGYRYDLILESATGGTDTVSVGYFGNSSYTLDPNVENAVVSGSAGFTVIGNGLGNSLTGNAAHNLFYGEAGDDMLNGGAGFDELLGGDGNDAYVLDDVSVIDEQSGSRYDAVGEAENGGNDTVFVSYQGNARFFLDDNVENVQVTGAGSLEVFANGLGNNLVGNAAHNLFYGQGGNDTIDGGAGYDELIGGDGDDFYFLHDLTFIDDQSGSRYDAVGEAANGGTDTVFVSYQGNARFFLDAHVENVQVTGTGSLEVFANDLDNSLIGNAAHNLLFGDAGDDTLSGGAGIDTLYGGAGSDHFIDSPVNLYQDQIADLGLDDIIEVSGVRFGALHYNPTTGVLALDSNANGSFATLVNLAAGLVGEFVATPSAADQPASTQVRLMLDSDGDGVGDFRDNAIGVPNADQRDSDGDGYGNVADADFNQDLMVDLFDLSMLGSVFFTGDPDADLNGDGVVDFVDLSLLDSLFGKAPGPSYVDPAAPVEPLAAAHPELLLVGLPADTGGSALGELLS